MTYNFNYYRESVDMTEVGNTKPDRSVNYATLVEAVNEGTAIMDADSYQTGVIINPDGTQRLYYFYKKQAKRVVGTLLQ